MPVAISNYRIYNKHLCSGFSKQLHYRLLIKIVWIKFVNRCVFAH